MFKHLSFWCVKIIQSSSVLTEFPIQFDMISWKISILWQRRQNLGMEQDFRRTWDFGYEKQRQPPKKFKRIFTKFLDYVKRIVYTVVSECAEFKSGHRLEFRLTHFCVLWPSHTATETTKTLFRPYTLKLCLTTATIFSTVLYMDNDFHKNFFGKIFVKIVVVCEGLYPYFGQFHAKSAK